MGRESVGRRGQMLAGGKLLGRGEKHALAPTAPREFEFWWIPPKRVGVCPQLHYHYTLSGFSGRMRREGGGGVRREREHVGTKRGRARWIPTPRGTAQHTLLVDSACLSFLVFLSLCLSPCFAKTHNTQKQLFGGEGSGTRTWGSGMGREMWWGEVVVVVSSTDHGGGGMMS